MRALITSNGLLVVLALIILTHCVIIGNNVRESEVSSGLNSSMDYAYDKMIDSYHDTLFTLDYEKNNTDAYNSFITARMTDFCETLQSQIGSNGQIIVQLLKADLETGTFQIRVTEYYKNPMNVLGQCSYEKTYSLY